MRPSFDEIRAELETNFKEVTEAQGEDWQMPLCGHVSALRNHWESLPRSAKAAAPLVNGCLVASEHSRAASPTLDELRKRLDKNGYVTDAVFRRENHLLGIEK